MAPVKPSSDSIIYRITLRIYITLQIVKWKFARKCLDTWSDLCLFLSSMWVANTWNLIFGWILEKKAFISVMSKLLYHFSVSDMTYTSLTYGMLRMFGDVYT